MHPTIAYTAELRADLIEGYESERENWGDETTDRFIAAANRLPLNEPLPLVDLTDVDENACADPESVQIGLDYFGIPL